ncbi:exocyst complex component [Acrasis kona]|uniref:Exocyst complex component Sec8 n=1 Tax=Acrasis kona TaxID=1008807 RepID=A0AAW2ZAJ2_9EUKA
MSDRSKSQEDKELEKQLKDVLKKIPQEYKDRGFSHIAVVAKALKGKSPQDDLKKLNQYYNSLNGAVSDIVNVNYSGFNKSIKNFSDILNNLEGSQKKIKTLEGDIDRCKELLASRANDLAQLYANYLQHTEFLNILNQVEEVKSVPEQLQKAIDSKHYLYAVNMIIKYAEVLKQNQLKSIKALHQIRQDLEKNRAKLPDILIDELNRHVYNGSNAVPVTLSEVLNSNRDKHADSTMRRNRNARKLTRMNSTQSTNGELTITDDVSLDPERDSHFFMTMVIEALDRLNKLPEVQSRLIQGLRFELRSLMFSHINTFVRSLETTDTEVLWTVIQNQSNSEVAVVHKARIQGQLLIKMLESLFGNMNGVLSNFRYVVEVMTVKFNKMNQDEEVSNNVHDGMNLKLTKEVISRLKDTVRVELDQLRNDKKSEPLYLESLETFQHNFINKTANQIEHIETLRIKDIPNVFKEMVASQAAMKSMPIDPKTIQSINSQFDQLLSRSMSSPDNPRLLTAEHVWKMIQEELIIILKDLLAIVSDQLKSNSTSAAHSQSSSSSSSQNTSNTTGANSSNSTSSNKGIKFRFGSNFELHSSNNNNQDNEQKTEDDIHLFSTTTSPLLTFFLFTPYNMIWMFKCIKDFVKSAQGIIHESNDAASSLNDFMNDAIKGSLIPKVRNDYRSRLNKLTREPDAFRPQEFIYTKTNPQYEKDLNLRPLLHSSIQLSRWLEELHQLATAIPLYRNDFCEIMELLLKKYLEECKIQFKTVIEGKYVGTCILGMGDVISTLEKDPAWKHLQDPSQPSAQDESNQEQMKTIVDGSVLEMMQKQTIQNHTHSDHLLINHVSSLVLLANLNDSLEWLSEQVTGISRWAADNPTTTTTTTTMNGAAHLSNTGTNNSASNASLSPPPHHHGRRQSVMNTIKKIQHHQHMVMQVGSGSSFVIRSLENYHLRFKQLASWCLFALKVDIRAHVFHFLKTPLKNHSYCCEDTSTQPETFVNNFNVDLARIERSLCTYLPKEKKQYLFDGLGRLIADLLIDSVMHMTHKKFNQKGIQKMNRNIFSIQQNITNIVDSREILFNRVRQYYNMLELSEKEFFNLISSGEHEQLFTEEQYAAVLRCLFERDAEDPNHVESWNKKRDTLAQVYAEVLQETR